MCAAAEDRRGSRKMRVNIVKGGPRYIRSGFHERGEEERVADALLASKTKGDAACTRALRGVATPRRERVTTVRI